MHPTEIVHREASATFYALLNSFEVLGEAAATLFTVIAVLGVASAILLLLAATLRHISLFPVHTPCRPAAARFLR